MKGGYEMIVLQMKGMSENEGNGCCDKKDEWQPSRNVMTPAFDLFSSRRMK